MQLNCVDYLLLATSDFTLSINVALSYYLISAHLSADSLMGLAAVRESKTNVVFYCFMLVSVVDTPD